MNDQVKVPTKEQLESALMQMMIQRSQLKDNIEQLEKQMPPLQAQLQLLQAQAKAAEAEASND